jgi:DNA-directed RNA polymerase specialized sigma24 family protein
MHSNRIFPLQSMEIATDHELIATAQRAEDRGQVRAALERLRAKDRTILVMREFEGLNYATISTSLKIRMGTLHSRLF